MKIKPLDWLKDRHTVAVLFSSAADYVTLATGSAPNIATVDKFFEERPPNVSPENDFGAYEGEHLIGIAGMLFGYPHENDAYIGLLLISPGARGMGTGAHLLTHLTNVARARGMTRQLVAVLDANPKGRAFWDREGFVFETTFPPSDDHHTRHRLTRAI